MNEILRMTFELVSENLIDNNSPLTYLPKPNNDQIIKIYDFIPLFYMGIRNLTLPRELTEIESFSYHGC